jgi:hypothetical protein
VLLATFLAPVIRDCYWRHGIVITSFTTTFISQQNGDSLLVAAVSNTFNPEQIKRTKELKPGDEIYFENIRVIGGSGSGCPRKLPSFTIKIE